MNLIKVRDALRVELAQAMGVHDQEEVQRRLDMAGLSRRVIGDGADISEEALLRQAQELVVALPEVPWDPDLLADCLYVDPAEFEALWMEAMGGRKRKVDMGPGSSAGRAVD